MDERNLSWTEIAIVVVYFTLLFSALKDEKFEEWANQNGLAFVIIFLILIPLVTGFLLL